MDMAYMFMLFCTITPFLLWSRRRAWALVQIPLIVGMWIYPYAGQTSAFLGTLLAVLFYGNLIYTEAALVRWMIDLGHSWKNRRDSIA